ncbi:MAG: hypothetical protein WD690_11755 [Vicinamibacterales bacterium]
MLAVVTFATFECAPYFLDRAAVAIVRTQFLRAAAENRCEILTYGFVPDGVCLLIETCEADAGADRAAFISASRRYSSRAFRVRTGRRLWDSGAADTILRDMQSASASARYVLSAPINGSFAWDRLEQLLHIRARRHA